MILAIEAWNPSKASLLPLVIISSVFFLRKLEVLSFPVSSLIIFPILKNYLSVSLYHSQSICRRCQVLKTEKHTMFRVSNLLVGYTTQEFLTKVKFCSRKIYNAVSTLFHLSIRKPVNVPYTRMFQLCHEILFLSCANYNFRVSLIELLTDSITLI